MLRVVRPFSTSTRALSEVKKITPSLLNLKVGYIEEINNHPNADKLYVSSVRISKDLDPITVCSGLVGYIPKETLLKSKVVLVTNLKPSKMRGIKSEAMVLAAEQVFNDQETKVELVRPPVSSEVGDQLVFEGYTTNPSRMKPKDWELLQYHLFSEDGRVVYTGEENVKSVLMAENGDLATVSLNGSVR